jgi:hypothetical protein
LKKFDFIPSCLTFCGHHTFWTTLDHPLHTTYTSRPGGTSKGVPDRRTALSKRIQALGR